jgi:hypothetical protein
MIVTMKNIEKFPSDRVRGVAGLSGIRFTAIAAFALLASAAPSLAQGANCQAGTGPYAGFATFAQLDSAAWITPNVCAFDSAINIASRTKIKHVLLMNWTNGANGQAGGRHMYRLARKYGFRLTATRSNTYISPTTLEGVDLVVFNEGGYDPLSNVPQLSAMRDFIEVKGKGMLAIHEALYAINCPNQDATVPSLTQCRWFFRAYGANIWQSLQLSAINRVRIYADSVMVGEIPPKARGPDSVPAGYAHGRKNPETSRIFEGLPLNGPSGPLANRLFIWEGLYDTWANYLNHPRRAPIGVYAGIYWGPVNILLSIDESPDSYPDSLKCYSGSPCKTGDRPVSWTRQVGKGLAAYNNAGYSDVYVRARVVAGDTVRDSLMEKYNWRLMKYLARDFVGCMDSSFAEYNPEASVEVLTPGIDDPDPCKTPVSLRPGISVSRPLPGIASRGRSILIALRAPGDHRIRITDVQGRGVVSAVARGSGDALESPELSPGLYFVRVGGPGGTTARRILID